MRALPQAQISIYDLLQGGSYQRLRSAFAQYDIKVDPRTLILNNQSKESVLSQILSDLESSPKLVNLASVSQENFNQKEVQDYLSEKKSINDAKIVGFIRCLQMYFLSQEAAHTYFKMEQLKVLQQELRVLLLKLASAEYERQLQIAEAEKIKILEAQQNLSAIITVSFHDSFDACLHKLNDIENRMHAYNQQLSELKEEKHHIRAQMREDSLLKAEKLKELCPSLAHIDNDVLVDFITRVRERQNKVESTLNKFDQKDKYDLKIIEESDTALATLSQKQAQLDAEIRNAKHLYGGALVAAKHDKHVRIPDAMRLDFEQRQREINESRQGLLDNRKYHQDNFDTRSKKREDLLAKKAQIMEQEIAKSPNSFQAALENPSVMEKVKTVLTISDVDRKFIENRKNKNAIKIQKKDDFAAAKADAAQQAKPLQQLHVLHHNHPTPEQDRIAAKAEQLENKLKNIQLLVEKYKAQKHSPRPC